VCVTGFVPALHLRFPRPKRLSTWLSCCVLKWSFTYPVFARRQFSLITSAFIVRWLLALLNFFIIVHSFVRRLHLYVFSTAISCIFGADLELTDEFSAVFSTVKGFYPRSIDRWTVRVRTRSYTLWLVFSWLCGDRLFCVQFTFCRGHTRLCGVQCVCLVYRLRSVVVSLDCVVYRVFVWCTVYVLSCSHLTVKCTICLLGVPFAFCRGHTWRCSVPCVCVVYCLRSVVVTLDGVVYNMFVWCTVYVLSWSHLTV